MLYKLPEGLVPLSSPSLAAAVAALFNNKIYEVIPIHLLALNNQQQQLAAAAFYTTAGAADAGMHSTRDKSLCWILHKLPAFVD